MNRLVIVLFALAALAAAVPVEEKTPIPILRQSIDGPNPDGTYEYSYETANGIQANEHGYFLKGRTDEEVFEAKGGYSYTGPDGQLYKVTYVANDQGFQPQGDHIPTIPPLIKKALEYIAAHPEENNIDEQ